MTNEQLQILRNDFGAWSGDSLPPEDRNQVTVYLDYGADLGDIDRVEAERFLVGQIGLPKWDEVPVCSQCQRVQLPMMAVFYADRDGKQHCFDCCDERLR